MILENLHNSQEIGCLRHATLLKKSPRQRCFPVIFAKYLKTPFLTKQLWWLLPKILNSWLSLYQNRCFHKFWTKLLYLYLQSYLYAMYGPEKLRVRSYRASKDLRHAGNVCARNISCEQIKKSFNILIFLYFEYLGIAWHLLF